MVIHKKMYVMLLISFLPASLFGSVGWNTAVTTSATIDALSGYCLQEDYAEMDLFANTDGLHLLAADDDGVKYRRYNSAGTVQSTSTLRSSGEFPNIIGDDDDLYILYVDDDTLFVEKSTNNGSSWSLNEYRALDGSNATGVDVALNSNGLHVVYGDDGDVHYRRLNSSTWYDYQQISNNGFSAGSPHIALSGSRIHVSWNEYASQYFCYSDTAKTRDKVSSTWQSEQAVVDTSIGEMIVSDGTDLHMLYYIDAPSIHRLKHLSRGVSFSIWSTETAIGSTDLTSSGTVEVASVSTDGTLHVIAAEGTSALDHFTYNGSSWTSGTEITGSTSRKWHAMTSNSNDKYVFWAKTGTSVDTIEYRQYDAVPTAPTGMSISGSTGQNPTISWNANPETDLSTYYVYRNVVWDRYTQTGWQYKASTSNTSWTDTNFLIGGLTSTA